MCLRFNLGACMLSCVQLCDPMDCSQPGSSDHGISQAKVLEWVGSSYSRGLLFPTQGSTPHLLGLLLWQADSWPLCYVGSPGNVVSLVNYEPSPRMPLRSSSMFIPPARGHIFFGELHSVPGGTSCSPKSFYMTTVHNTTHCLHVASSWGKGAYPVAWHSASAIFKSKHRIFAQ